MLDKSDTSKITNTENATRNVNKYSPSSQIKSWNWLRAGGQFVLMMLILSGGFFGMTALIASKPEKPERPIFPRVYTVETIVAKTANHQPKIFLYGEVVAGRSVDLRSLVSGQVTSVSQKLKSGGMVQKGDALVEIDRFNYEGQLREANANAAETKARIQEYEAGVRLETGRLGSVKEQLALAQKDLDRIQQLRIRGAATAKQVEDKALILSQRSQSVEQSEVNIIAANAKLAQQKAVLERLEWKIELSQRNLKDTILVAPFSGTISSTQVQAGKLVGANDVLVSMYQSDLLEARFVLTDERFGRIQADGSGLIGRPVNVTWTVGGSEYVYKAKIDRIGAEIASTRGGVEVFATIQQRNADIALRPGAFVDINLADRIFKNHIQLPDTALYNGDTIYIVKQKKLMGKKVSIASFVGESILIKSGISAGDEVLTTRISEVGNGLRVRNEGDPVRTRTGRQNKGRPAGANGARKAGQNRISTQGGTGNRPNNNGNKKPNNPQ